MKIVTKDNFGRDFYAERVIAENVPKYFGEQFVELHNEMYWKEHSDYYLALVEDDYELYDGYADLF